VSSLYFLFVNQYSLGGSFSFLLGYKLSLCHTPIKPDLLGFPVIGVFACRMRDHVIMRFVSVLPVINSIFFVSSSSSIFLIFVMYSARERERRRILAHGCEKLSQGLGVLEQEVDRCKRLFYDLQASWEKEVQRQKK